MYSAHGCGSIESHDFTGKEDEGRDLNLPTRPNSSAESKKLPIKLGTTRLLNQTNLPHRQQTSDTAYLPTYAECFSVKRQFSQRGRTTTPEHVDSTRGGPTVRPVKTKTKSRGREGDVFHPSHLIHLASGRNKIKKRKRVSTKTHQPWKAKGKQQR